MQTKNVRIGLMFKRAAPNALMPKHWMKLVKPDVYKRQAYDYYYAFEKYPDQRPKGGKRGINPHFHATKWHFQLPIQVCYGIIIHAACNWL